MTGQGEVTERGSKTQAHPPRGGSFEGLLASREIAITCGPGGVGKTTTAAAAAAMAACRHGGRVLVLTVDPARRLAGALGLSGIGNEERRVPDEAFRAWGVVPRGELWAAMLDTKQSWDSLIRRHAPDARTRDQILANPLYRNITGRFVQSHDYIAMERLFEIHSEGTYDLIVVDTPPSRHAIDFLDAPRRMAEFFSSKLLRWLIAPYRSRLVNIASRPFSQVADRLLGTQFLVDISEFFVLFQSLYDGFVQRAEAVSRLLRARRTSFIVVTTLESASVQEVESLTREIQKRGLHLGAIVLNKVLPEYFASAMLAQTARELADRAGSVSQSLGGEPDLTERVLREIADSFLNFNVVARREAKQQQEFRPASDVVTTVPWLDGDVSDIGTLLRVGERLWE